MFNPELPKIMRRVETLEKQREEAILGLSKKWNLHPMYISAAYAFSRLQRKGIDKEVNSDLKGFLEEISLGLLTPSYLCGGLLSKSAEGAPIQIHQEGENVRYTPRCVSVLLTENCDRPVEGDLIICFDVLLLDNYFRVIDGNGKSIRDYCKSIPGSEKCYLVKEDVKVRNVSLSEVLEMMEKRFTEKNKNFPEIKKEVSRTLDPIFDELGELEKELRASGLIRGNS
ncbi:MAG TPA: hypothetical protein ENG56_00185 [Candidatus Aenigmarchaeota archaeon]|nr:hypothetical protein [Candidatus Aenigmarchaeota archaeon]